MNVTSVFFKDLFIGERGIFLELVYMLQKELHCMNLNFPWITFFLGREAKWEISGFHDLCGYFQVAMYTMKLGCCNNGSNTYILVN